MKNFVRRIDSVGWVMMFSAVVVIWVSANLNWGDGRWNRIVKVDGVGYFSYLPAIFVYGDLSFDFREKIAANPDHHEFYFDYRKQYKGKTINKYYVGTALLMTPFYLVGHALNFFTGNSMDGCSVWELIFIQIAAIFYLFLGLWWLSLTLKTYEVSVKNRAWVLMAALFGTNLFYYVTGEPAMSHVFSFAMVSGFVVAVRRYFITVEVKWFLWASVAFGLVLLTRPVNGLVLFSLPFLSGSGKVFKTILSGLFKKPLLLVSGLLLVMLIVGIQGVIYYLQTEYFFVYSYQGEGFNFSNPQIFRFLFSYRKGLFVYTPMCLLALSGLWYVWKESRMAALAYTGFLLMVVYVLSSWWLWYYGGSFSSRVMIEYFPFFMIMLGIFMQRARLSTWIKVAMIILVLVCQIQTFQYRYGYLHYDSLTKDLYWNSFLRIDRL